MARHSTVHLPWDLVERDRSYIENNFPGIVLPDTYSIKKIIEKNNSPKLSGRIPNLPEYEKKKDKLIRYGITGAELDGPKTYHTPPAAHSVINDVPVSRDITNIKQLRSDHIVFYNVGTGEVQCVITRRDKDAERFYYRYYSNMPLIAAVPGNVYRKYANDKTRKMLTRNGIGIKWLSLSKMKEYIASNNRPNFADGAEYDIVDQPASFAERVHERPVLDLARVRFVFVRYYSHEKVSA
jgi:hypothetical protein